jgi:hypothetical protein
VYGHGDDPQGSRFLCADGDESTAGKQGLDQVHLRKIELADEVLVVNVGGYVGSSTLREIAHAVGLRKPVRFLFPDAIPDDAAALFLAPDPSEIPW